MNLFERKYKKKHEEWNVFSKNLQLADIILVRSKRALIGKGIRIITGSYWDHAALVFMVPNPRLQFYNHLIIEANREGLVVHRIQEYTEKFRYYDIGVKRVPGMDEQTREKVLAFMLNQVDRPYDMSRAMGFFLRSFDVNILKDFSSLLVDKQDFVCSSFIQDAFYHAFSDDKKHEVVFHNVRKEKIKDDLLRYVSPGDIAKSKQARWLYNPHN